MEIVSIKNNEKYLKEYIRLCSLEWGSNKSKQDLDYQLNKITNDDKVILVLGLIDNNELLGFISLFKYDGEERKDLTPWYAPMYVKKEHRKKGYSKLLKKNQLH